MEEDVEVFGAAMGAKPLESGSEEVVFGLELLDAFMEGIDSPAARGRWRARRACQRSWARPIQREMRRRAEASGNDKIREGEDGVFGGLRGGLTL
jgi:hypothetical protein